MVPPFAGKRQADLLTLQMAQKLSIMRRGRRHVQACKQVQRDCCRAVRLWARGA